MNRLSTTQLYKEIAFNALGNKCWFCGDSGKDLVIHHKDRNYLNNSLNNLLLLHRSCHGKLHTYSTEFMIASEHNAKYKLKIMKSLLDELKGFLIEEDYNDLKQIYINKKEDTKEELK